MANVIIYTKTYCPYSKNCKAWLDEKKINFDEKVVDNDDEMAAEMKVKSGDRNDTPQVFINDHHIGSFDDLKALDATDKLDSMLNA
ncbi:MAG: glutaredoxin domain-containing protein [bacterium]|nr:glutaredoxin domain-containing protein [bacterium]